MIKMFDFIAAFISNVFIATLADWDSETDPPRKLIRPIE